MVARLGLPARRGRRSAGGAGHRRAAPLDAAWIAAFLVGFGPFTIFLLTRLVGLPGDPGDFGNWGDSLGTVSLLVEGTLMVIAIAAIRHLVRVNRGLPAGAAAAADRRPRERTRVPVRAESDAA